ncbi:MAG TPA: hypothetical protein PLE30_01355 [Candidatus Kapabacteria bacterium]|nr:hypothetical protein [Candidatus Kapabacteria bacterium]
MQKALLAIDCGTTRIKYILKDKGALSFVSQGNIDNIEQIIDNYRYNNKELEVLILGTNAKLLNLSVKTTNYDELICTAHLPLYYNCNNALVVNIGTGTAFLSIQNNNFRHLIGTGLGGGTLLGLSQRFLCTENVYIINELSRFGKLEAINTTIEDVQYNNVSWLDKSMTVSNFSKQANSQSDIAAGIISLVIEPIISICKSLVIGQNYERVYFAGSVLDFNLARELIEKYSSLLEIDSVIIEKYEYGTLLGALAYYNKLNVENEI